MEARLPQAYQRPVSAWRAAEKQRYEAMLAERRFDTLVVPFQVQDHAFARDIRSLMTAQLALAMAASPGAKVSIADPHVVARAFGDGERRYDLAEVLRLANAFKVARPVAAFRALVSN